MRCFLIHKNPDTLHYVIFHEIFEIGGGGGGYEQKTIHFASHFYMQKKIILHYVLLHKMYRIVYYDTGL